ncbi:carbohydrate ABC transporter permease [Ruminococcaceae bacterium OttesenSCG-928-L11]|nr:carbohydrate ABC transporter permease [Ruminococcaceae bacterium OttesenSCG-928-L11]
MRLKRITRGEWIFRIVNTIVLIGFSLIILIPLWTVVMNSFVSQAEIMRRGVFIFIPEEWNLDAYRLLLGKGSNVYRAYLNTFFIVTVGTALNLVFTITLAYGLSKRYLKGRVFFTGMIFFTMLFNGGMVPNYILVKSLGLLDSLWAVIMPGLVSTWNMFIMRNFFYAIPDSLEEAAFLDGANPIQVLVKIILPLSLPSIATIGLFYAVGHWNSWFGAMLYINTNTRLPMQNILRNIVATTSAAALQDVDTALFETMQSPPPSQAMKAATIIVGTVPILVVYPFIQKYFVKGVMVGSIKG